MNGPWKSCAKPWTSVIRDEAAGAITGMNTSATASSTIVRWMARLPCGSRSSAVIVTTQAEGYSFLLIITALCFVTTQAARHYFLPIITALCFIAGLT